METFTTVPTMSDARVLFRVAPDDYVTERTRLVKEARAAGDRALAKSYAALKRPNLSLWAVLAADDDNCDSPCGVDHQRTREGPG